LFALIASDLFFCGKAANGYSDLVQVPSDLAARRPASRLPVGGIKRYREERAKGTPDDQELIGILIEEFNVSVLKSCGSVLGGSF
jgi:hypothetical protein